MKSTGFFRLLISIIGAVTAVNSVNACGPFHPIIPTPEFFRLSGMQKSMTDYEREENLKLWQSLTSEHIPLRDIEEVVYKDPLSKFYTYTSYQCEKSDNLFYIYLANSNDKEVVDFLATAKRLEERWKENRSVWYYPRDRASDDETDVFPFLIDFCKRYAGKRLKDRYALQVTRALFASRRYSDCIEYADSVFADISDNNLMKRMARRYAAGCWKRLGDEGRADSMFAKSGDVWSLSTDNPAAYMIKRNPDAPQLIDYIRSRGADTIFMQSLYPEASRLVKQNKVSCPGDWCFVMAYVDNEFNQRKASARKHIYSAMDQNFSSEELRNLARAYKMKIDGQTGNIGTLVSDLRWIEGMAGVLESDADEWVRRCRNIIYVDWVPRLWKNKDYSTAILLCAYADNLSPSGQWYERSYEYLIPTLSFNAAEMRESEDCDNQVDYGCLSFQMMGSLSSAQLASVYSSILSDTPLYRFLRRKARTDKDYYNELIGTLALREENYACAEKYLSKVSDHYLRTMNIDKCGYLCRDPFKPYPSRWEVVTPTYPGGEPWESEHIRSSYCYKSDPDAKLKFARKMQEYHRQMLYGRTVDEQGLGRLMYAIGRRNSFEECWALTQYWRGGAPALFEPSLQYWDDVFTNKFYAFLYDYEKTVGHKATEKRYEDELNAALAMLTTDEARAKAHYILNNLKTIVKHYGDTSTGQYVKASCDNWKSWL